MLLHTQTMYHLVYTNSRSTKLILLGIMLILTAFIIRTVMTSRFQVFYHKLANQQTSTGITFKEHRRKSQTFDKQHNEATTKKYSSRLGKSHQQHAHLKINSYTKIDHSLVKRPASGGKDCQKLHFAPPGRFPVTAIASFPGSGNTWIRHLIQQATGYYTGSIYNSPLLLMNGLFPGEGRTDNSVIGVKTHHGYGEVGHRFHDPIYKRAVLLIRKVKETILAEYNRRNAGKTAHMELSKINSKDFYHFVKKATKEYIFFHKQWLKEFKSDIYIVNYEDLRQNLSETLKGLSRFLLGHSTNEQLLYCVRNNSEGTYHRTSAKKTDLFISLPNATEWSIKLMTIDDSVETLINTCLRRGNCLNYLLEKNE